MSIHKSQGQTLDRVKVDLGKVFEKGKVLSSLYSCIDAFQAKHTLRCRERLLWTDYKY